jgi:hypothetical protein
MTVSDNYLALAPLVGLPLRTIGRASNLLWLHFGEWRTVPAARGGTRTVGQWALHIQCDWSISKFGSPVISSADYYVSPKGADLGNDWDITGANRFDQLANTLRAEFETAPLNVASMDCGDAGMFSMRFDDGSELIALPVEGGLDEAWRLFQPGTELAHFVVPPES